MLSDRERELVGLAVDGELTPATEPAFRALVAGSAEALALFHSYARQARRLRALLAQGPFELHPLPSGRDRDRYGRKLRIVTRGGQSIGDVLVAEGLARTWTGRREPWCG